MADRAQVASVEAVDAFRAKTIVFLTKARAAVDEVIEEIQRTQGWLDNDQRTYWERELRRRQRQLDEAQQELFSAKISRLRTQTAAQVLAVERAKAAVRHAEEKRDAVKRWAREFEMRAEPLAKQVEQLQTFLAGDLTKAAVYLGTVVKVLQEYALIASPALEAAPAPAARTDDAPEPLLPSEPQPQAQVPANPD